MQIKLSQHWAAWSACQAVRERWLISDPLRYAEFEQAGTPPSLPADGAHAVEIDILSKPKQSGGLRLEVFPDVFTATFLQAVVDRLGDQQNCLKSSLSARLFGLRLKQDNPYQAWSAMVPTWIRTELASKRVVVIIDILDYFSSITRTQIGSALRTAGLEEEILQHTLRLFDAINRISNAGGVTRSGLPVSPEDIFWLVADLVLAPIDSAIEGLYSVRNYARWVDDFFISTEPNSVDRVIAEVESVLRLHGFRVNDGKTQVISSPENFEREFLSSEHEIVTDLFLVQAEGALSPQQHEAFLELIGRRDAINVEESRLVKRVYGLARRLHSPLLVERAGADLQRFPVAELQIISYLGGLGWPIDTLNIALDSIAGSCSDSRTIGVLRALLDSSNSITPELRLRLRNVVSDRDSIIHPYAIVLAFACLAKDASREEQLFDSQHLLARIPTLSSATARRVALELLYLVPEMRSGVRERLSEDPSPTVQALQLFLMNQTIGQIPVRLLRALDSTFQHRFNWGGLDRLIAHELLPHDLVSAMPTES